MDTICIGDLVLCVAPEPGSVIVEEDPKPARLDEFTREEKTVGEVARKYGWKEEVRVIGHDDIPPNPVVVNGWRVMKATDYTEIVPLKYLDRVQILLDEGVDLKGLLIADDLRKHKSGLFWQLALRATERVRAIDWQNVRAVTGHGISVCASAIYSIVSSLLGSMKRKSAEIDWGKVRTALGEGLKVSVVAVGGAALGVLALPLLVLAAIPAALLAFDPLLIAVDSENRWWVIAEWYD